MEKREAAINRLVFPLSGKRAFQLPEGMRNVKRSYSGR